MTIRRRMTISLAVASSTLMIALLFGRWTINRVREEVDSARQSHLVVLKETEHVARGLSSLTVGLGQLGTAAKSGSADRVERINDSLAASFESTYVALAGARKAITYTRSDLILNSTIRADISELEARVRTVEASWRHVQLSTSTRELSDAAAAASSEASTALNDSLTLQNSLMQRTQSELGNVSNSLRHVSTMVGVVSALLITLSIAASLIISRWFSKRLDVLRVSSLRVAGGSIDVRIDDIGNDEFGEVARAFNEMVDTLETTQRRLEHDALHDALTGLPNRTLFLDRVTHRLHHAQRNADHDYALIFLDLDHFKRVNDVFGHAVGDELLQLVSGRLMSLIRELDQEHCSRNIVARLGGDEFTILIEHFTAKDRSAFAEELAAKFQAVIAAPVALCGQDMHISTSLGIILGSAERADAAALLRDADAALYRAKADGRGRHAMFDVKMHESIARRLQLEHDLRSALSRNEMLLYYQPISDLRPDSPGGFEALVRWKRGEQLMSPDQFIPIAEETGLIVKLGEWVITEACRQLKQWQSTLGKSIVMSVNVSPRQLSDRNLVPHLQKTLAETGISPKSLIVEITETAFVERGPACEALAAIRALGIRVYMDDFGTGYSTLGSLNDYPVDGIKLDRSFIKKNEGREDQLAVIEAVVHLAHQLNMPVVAEGVETPVQLAMLQGLGCDKVQGYYFAKPMAAEQALAYMANKLQQAEAA